MSGVLLLEEARWRFVRGRGWTSPHEGKDGDLPDEQWRDQAVALLRKRGLTVSPIGRRALSVALLQGADDPTWVECLRSMEACRAPKEGTDGAILGRRVWIEVRGDRADIEPNDTKAQSADRLRAAFGDEIARKVMARREEPIGEDDAANPYGVLCPVCGSPKTGGCRCRRGESHCANGHNWHTCLAHGRRVVTDGPLGHGPGLPGLGECTCHLGKDGGAIHEDEVTPMVTRAAAERFVSKFFPGGMDNPNARAVIDGTFGSGDDVDESWEGAWRILNAPITELLKDLAEAVRRRVEDASERAGHRVSIPGWVAREALGHVDPREIVRGVAKVARERGWKLGLAAALLEVADHVLAPYIAAKAGLPAPVVAAVAAMPWSETIVYPLIIRHVVRAVRAAGASAPPELARECDETPLSRLLML